MRVLIATDAWHPQVNGVVRTLTSLAATAPKVGFEVVFLNPEGFPSVPVPTYPGLRCALASPRTIARRIEEVRPDAIHIATEGTIGHLVRHYCRARGIPFTTSYTTRFPEYISARLPIRPIFVSVGRIAVEKNLEAFLSLDLPGSKVVIGQGPQTNALRRRFPAAKFMGLLDDKLLAAYVAGSDGFVFPSRTDTFGVVQLEALACGVPVAAYPVTGPLDVIGREPIGVLDEDLRAACMGALRVSRKACRNFALTKPWEASARQFLAHVERVAVTRVAVGQSPKPHAA
jgi:hypothetical protein